MFSKQNRSIFLTVLIIVCSLINISWIDGRNLISQPSRLTRFNQSRTPEINHIENSTLHEFNTGNFEFIDNSYEFIGGIGAEPFSKEGLDKENLATGSNFDLGLLIELAVDAKGNILIADRGTGQIVKFDPIANSLVTIAGTGSKIFNGDGKKATKVNLDAEGIALDKNHNIFIADRRNHRIRKMDGTTGAIKTIAGTGKGAFSGDGKPATSASLNFPNSVAVDANGNIFFADEFNNRVRKIDAVSGVISTVAGNGKVNFTGNGGAALSTALVPHRIAFDQQGNLNIADVINSRVYRLDINSGTVTLLAGTGDEKFAGDGGPATAAGLEPDGIATDSNGNLYIADELNHRIRKIDAATGTISTIAGTGKGKFSGDGGPATSAGIDPINLTFDTKGHLIIADIGNRRIRQINLQTGTISTILFHKK